MSQGFESQHRGFHPPFQAFETNCIIKYSTWPVSGTTVTNEGRGGATYNGTTADNDYSLSPSGATSFVFNDTTDYVKIPKGAAVDNLGAHTIELAFFYGVDTVYTARIWDKNNTTTYHAFIDPATKLISIRRYASNGTAYRLWITDNQLVAGTNYFIQIAWDATSFTSDPTVKINNATQTLTTAHSGSTTAWLSDSALDFLLLNTSDWSRGLKCTLYLFRIHNAVLTDAQLTQNYNADKWRMGL